MANEITVNGSLVLNDGVSSPVALQLPDTFVTITNHPRIAESMTVATGATAIPVSGLTSPGWAMFINRDPTNYIDLYTDNGANKKAFARLAPGLPCGPIFLGTDAKAPYALAHTAACILEFLICDS